MGWSGKALGGLFGALVGGPVGAGVGAAVGHYLGDSERERRALELVKLQWVHHAFRASGPGVVLTPVWRARGLVDADVTVRMDAAGACETVVVAPDHPVEEIEAPSWFVPYTRFPPGDAGSVTVTLRASRVAHDREEFGIPLPRGARRLGNSGPGRVVMALVACARAGDRLLTSDDRDYIQTRFMEGHPLDADGQRWLASWMVELGAAELSRLSADRVAERLAVHVDDSGVDRVLTWLMHGTRASWPGEGAEQYVDALARAMGARESLDALWAQVTAEPDPVALVLAARVLGIPMGTPLDVARREYRALVVRWHPDRARTPAETDAFTKRTAAINTAWSVFSGAR